MKKFRKTYYVSLEITPWFMTVLILCCNKWTLAFLFLTKVSLKMGTIIIAILEDQKYCGFTQAWSIILNRGLKYCCLNYTFTENDQTNSLILMLHDSTEGFGLRAHISSTNFYALKVAPSGGDHPPQNISLQDQISECVYIKTEISFSSRGMHCN